MALAAAKPIPKKVLALYTLSGKATDDVRDTPIHLHAEVVLNHLGLEVVYRRVEEALPKFEELHGYRGILTWFRGTGAISDPTRYCRWGKEMIEKGLKMVILEEPGFFNDEDRTTPEACEEMLEAMGLRYDGKFSDNPFYFEILNMDATMVAFERKLILAEGQKYSHFELLSPLGKSYLKMQRRDQEGSLSDLVVVTPRGGFVHPSYALFVIKELQKVAWRLNPFLFFEEAFGLKGLPRPDTNTLQGARIFYTHIDGDGILNESHIDNESYSGEMIYREILKKYSDIPITASIITGYLPMRRYQTERVHKMYRDIFSLPNVEVAAHGHAHPLKWQEKKLALKVPGYSYSDLEEINGSIQRVQYLLQIHQIEKSVNLFLWTGDCRPNEAQLSIPYQKGFLQMNGGDSRFDRRFDSYAFLHPLGLLRGTYRQIYSSAANENIYTHQWKGPYYGFEEVIESFKRTEDPIRIKPINIYYHYYSGEVAAALKALQDVYDYALSQNVFPIFASEYPKIVDGFFKTKMVSLGGGGFRIEQNGALKTLRFDREKRFVDLHRSHNVLGFRKEKGSLYVFLGDQGTTNLYLTTSKPNKPYVRYANFVIKDFSPHPARITFSKRGWHQSQMELGGLAPTTKYKMKVGEEEKTLFTDAEGDLNIPFTKAENHNPFSFVQIFRESN